MKCCILMKNGLIEVYENRRKHNLKHQVSCSDGCLKLRFYAILRNSIRKKNIFLPRCHLQRDREFIIYPREPLRESSRDGGRARPDNCSWVMGSQGQTLHFCHNTPGRYINVAVAECRIVYQKCCRYVA